MVLAGTLLAVAACGPAEVAPPQEPEPTAPEESVAHEPEPTLATSTTHAPQDEEAALRARGYHLMLGLGPERGVMLFAGQTASPPAGGEELDDTWTYDGTILTFDAINDECPDRVGTIVAGNGKWTKTP